MLAGAERSSEARVYPRVSEVVSKRAGARGPGLLPPHVVLPIALKGLCELSKASHLLPSFPCLAFCLAQPQVGQALGMD